MNLHSESASLAICVDNRGLDDLERQKVYRVLADESAASAGYVRVIDESGEDYLYPRSCFAKLDRDEAMASGFCVAPRVLTERECEELYAQLSSAQGRSRAGIRHLMGIAAVKSLANDPRLIEFAKLYMSGSPIPFRATLFEKSARANWLVAWHQDTALPLASKFVSSEWGPWSTKAGVKYARAPAWALERVVALRVHLDASTNSNGPLRVIAGSHKLGVLPDDEVLRQARTERSVECLCRKGGIVAMRPLIIHASSKCATDSPRRVLHIEYTDELSLSDKIEIAIA